MSLLSRFFRASHKAPVVSQPRPPSTSIGLGGSTSGVRRELLRVVLRDTLSRHGIPVSWVGCEMVTTSRRDGEAGMHMRLLVRHWDPRLLHYAMALQDDIQQALTQFDPIAQQWLRGISWQFELPDATLCPAMPEPGTWREAPPVVATAPIALASATAVLATVAEPSAVLNTIADLNLLFERNDAVSRKEQPGGGSRIDYEAPQPLFQSTEPALL